MMALSLGSVIAAVMIGAIPVLPILLPALPLVLFLNL